MQGNSEVIALLNDVLTAELTAVNQYFLDAKMFDNWGFIRLGERFRSESIAEMKDADELIERILYLEGHPNLQRLGNIRTGETATEKFRLALEVETEAIGRLNDGIAASVAVGDNGTRELLKTILVGEEGHADWLETQLAAIGQVGEDNYLSQQIQA
jgi:bacterioferritin